VKAAVCQPHILQWVCISSPGASPDPDRWSSFGPRWGLRFSRPPVPHYLQTMGTSLQVSCCSVAWYCMLLRVSVGCHYRSNEVNYHQRGRVARYASAGVGTLDTADLLTSSPLRLPACAQRSRTRSSVIAQRPRDAKACQRVLKWPSKFKCPSKSSKVAPIES